MLARCEYQGREKLMSIDLCQRYADLIQRIQEIYALSLHLEPYLLLTYQYTTLSIGNETQYEKLKRLLPSPRPSEPILIKLKTQHQEHLAPVFGYVFPAGASQCRIQLLNNISISAPFPAIERALGCACQKVTFCIGRDRIALSQTDDLSSVLQRMDAANPSHYLEVILAP